jgi:SAM-dependent methyltransferase
VAFLAREFPGARVRGVDPDEAAIRAVTQRLGLDPEGRIATKPGKARSLPYPDDFFDLVVQRHGLFFPSEIARVLRPQGHLAYVMARPRWRLLRTPPSRLRRPLRRMGFETVSTGEMEGEGYYVGRLDGD